jgi:hypothetical protein
VAFLPRGGGPDPAAQRHLAGRVAPPTIDSLDYRFGFSEGREDSDRVTYDFSAEAGPRLVTWAAVSPDLATLSSPTFDLNGDDAGPDQVPLLAGDFSDFLLIPPGDSGRIRLDGKGQVALAVYDLDQPAPGVTRGGLTFRREIPGATLISADFGQPGQTEVTFPVTVPRGTFSLDLYCQGGRAAAPQQYAALWVDGHRLGTPHGCARPGTTYDVGSGGNYFAGPLVIEGRRYRVGETVQITARLLTREDDSAATSDPQGLLALGVYRPSRGEARLEEVGGHRFSRTPQRVTSVVRGRQLVFTAPVSAAPLLLEIELPASGGFRRWNLVVDGQVAGFHEIAAPVAVTLAAGPLMPWHEREVVLRLVRGQMPSVPLRANVLVRVD